jgi:hypothetical protein
MKPAFPPFKDIVAIITFTGVRGGLAPLVREWRPPLPPVSYGPGALYREKGFRKTIDTLYAMIYIVAAAMVMSGVFLVVTALTP